MAEFLIFTNQMKEGGIEVMVKYETVWLSQKLIALLFNVDRTVITKHLKNIFYTHELEEDSVCAFFAHTAEDGKIYNIGYYKFQWATG